MLNWSQIVVHSSRYEIDDSIQVNRRHPCGSGAPPTGVDSSKVSREKKSEVNEKRCFNEAKNRAASSLWVRDFPVSTDFVFSKLLWEYSVLKLDLRTKTPFC